MGNLSLLSRIFSTRQNQGRGHGAASLPPQWEASTQFMMTLIRQSPRPKGASAAEAGADRHAVVQFAAITGCRAVCRFAGKLVCPAAGGVNAAMALTSLSTFVSSSLLPPT